jgi:hypothetical protein
MESNGLGFTRIPALGSVGVVALYLCQYIASGSIFLTGLDFAWPAGKTHASDAPSRLAQLAGNHRLANQAGEIASLRPISLEFVGPDGEHQFTDAILTSYRDSLNEVIALLGDQGLPVFDLRESGLPINAPGCSPSVFLDLLENQEPSGPTEIPSRPGSVVNGRPYLAQLIDRIGRCQDLIHASRSRVLETDETQKLYDLIESLDILFQDFPDAEWPSLSPGALARVQVMIDYFRTFILQRF